MRGGRRRSVGNAILLAAVVLVAGSCNSLPFTPPGEIVAAVRRYDAAWNGVNTMYAAVANRAPEIAVLRTLGFRPASVVGSFLLESLAIAILGGLIGCLLALPINGITTSTTNWTSFSEVAFPFKVTPDLLAMGLVFAAVMGLVGGFFPALRAARMPIVQALRQE